LLLLTACGSDSVTPAPDPTPVPTPTPAGIGAAGGTVSGPAGARVVIPAGALSAATAIAVTQDGAGAPALPAGITSAGDIFAFTPHGTTFAAPASVTVPFDPARLVAGRTAVVLKAAPGGAWETLPAPTITGSTATVTTSSFSFFIVASAARTLAVVSGDAQTGIAGAALAAPLVVRVRNAATQAPESGVVVSFAVSTGAGSVGTATVTTNADGLASTVWTTAAGVSPTVTATAPGVTTPAVFTATIIVPPPARSLAIVSGNAQTGIAGAALAAPLVVRLRNAATQAPESGVIVSFAVSTGAGSVGNATVTTNADGLASTVWTLAASASPTVTATAPGVTTPAVFTATVAPIPQITTSTIPNGSVGERYLAPLAATGVSVFATWTVSSGSLPAGITLADVGELRGTPTVVGTSTFTVRVTEGGQSATRQLTLTIAPAPFRLAVTTATLPNAIGFAPYRVELQSNGANTGPLTWSAQGLATFGLELRSEGVLQGTPNVERQLELTFCVSNGTQQACRGLSLLVTQRLTIATSQIRIDLPEVSRVPNGFAVDQQLRAEGGTLGPYTWALLAGQLPVGVTLTAEGRLLGRVTDPGPVTTTITVRLRDGLSTVDRVIPMQYVCCFQ